VLEVEDAVLAVLGRALAGAAVQLLVRVVVAGDVASLDAHHRAPRLLRAAHGAHHHHRREEEDDGEGELHGCHSSFSSFLSLFDQCAICSCVLI
jgi:hypothetical protein